MGMRAALAAGGQKQLCVHSSTAGTTASSKESFVHVLHIERGHCYAKYSPWLFHYKTVHSQMNKVTHLKINLKNSTYIILGRKEGERTWNFEKHCSAVLVVSEACNVILKSPSFPYRTGRVQAKPDDSAWEWSCRRWCGKWMWYFPSCNIQQHIFNLLWTHNNYRWTAPCLAFSSE